MGVLFLQLREQAQFGELVRPPKSRPPSYILAQKQAAIQSAKEGGVSLPLPLSESPLALRQGRGQPLEQTEQSKVQMREGEPPLPLSGSLRPLKELRLQRLKRPAEGRAGKLSAKASRASKAANEGITRSNSRPSKLRSPPQKALPPSPRPNVLKVFKGFVNDPSAGSPTETLLRLLLPLDNKV